MKMNIAISGQAGDGINTVVKLLIEQLKNKAYYVLSTKDYMSRVRGGQNTTFVRFSDQPVRAMSEHIDILVGFNTQSIKHLQRRLSEDTIIIAPFDEELIGKNRYLLDISKIKEISKNPKAAPMASLGALFKLLGFENFLPKHKKWNEKVTKMNQSAYIEGGHIIKSQLNLLSPDPEKRMVITGNEALGLGAMCADVTFYSAYPMAPSTGIMHYLATQEKKGNIIVEQAEDEIAAAMAAIGAASGGIRAMTGTSGGGFALMTEALGFAALGEIPIVMVDVQRPGPATGLPTRTEQGDLSFLLSASQGEFARIILAPHSVEDSFYLTMKAHDLAEKYRVPVIILTDEYLADSTVTMDIPGRESLVINRHFYQGESKDYKHYDYEQIIDQRAYPGMHDDMIIMNDSHVHLEDGHITEDPQDTIKNKHKLMKKMDLIENDLSEPQCTGPSSAKKLLISWGSVSPIVNEAIEDFPDYKHMAFQDLFPLKTEALKKVIKEADEVILVEQNYTVQFGRLLKQYINFDWDRTILKYDGRQFTLDDIKKALEV